MNKYIKTKALFQVSRVMGVW